MAGLALPVLGAQPFQYDQMAEQVPLRHQAQTPQREQASESVWQRPLAFGVSRCQDEVHSVVLVRRNV